MTEFDKECLDTTEDVAKFHAYRVSLFGVTQMYGSSTDVRDGLLFLERLLDDGSREIAWYFHISCSVLLRILNVLPLIVCHHCVAYVAVFTLHYGEAF